MFEIGGSLREARLKRNLTPADVQKAIRIRDRYLQALEEERWELLPGDAYVKGFLRTYADYLGLDGQLYVEEYNSRFARPAPDSGRRRCVARQFMALGPLGQRGRPDRLRGHASPGEDPAGEPEEGARLDPHRGSDQHRSPTRRQARARAADPGRQRAPDPPGDQAGLEL